MSCRNLYKEKDHYNIVWFGVGKVEKEYYCYIKLSNFEGLYIKESEINGIITYSAIYKSTQTYPNIFRIDTTTKEIKNFYASESRHYELDKINNYVMIRSNPQIEDSPLIIFGVISDRINNHDKPLDYFRNLQIIKNKAQFLENYSTKQESVKNDLIQRLSIIKGELWYKSAYGLPLVDKIRNKGIVDSVVLGIITECPGVKSIKDFKSSIDKHNYNFSFNLLTIYGDETFDINLSSR